MSESVVVAEPLRHYAGSGSRALAVLLDGLILFPLFTISMWGRTRGPGVALAAALVYWLIGTAYQLGFVAIRGATPGKRALKLLVVREDGGPVGWREAFLRDSVDILLGAVSLAAVAVVLARVDLAHYYAVGYTAAVTEASPAWRHLLTNAITAWFVLDAAVLLVNPRRRAIHDFIGGTVVMRCGPPS